MPSQRPQLKEKRIWPGNEPCETHGYPEVALKSEKYKNIGTEVGRILIMVIGLSGVQFGL